MANPVRQFITVGERLVRCNVPCAPIAKSSVFCYDALPSSSSLVPTPGVKTDKGATYVPVCYDAPLQEGQKGGCPIPYRACIWQAEQRREKLIVDERS